MSASTTPTPAPPARPAAGGRGLAARLALITGGASAAPLLVLFGLNFVDEFDRIAFEALTPEIRDAFALSDAGIGSIGVISGVFVLLAALPVGFLGDRTNRVRLSAAAALLWGSMAVLTGLVPTAILLFFVRLLSGIGRIINEVVHPSLLGDYYAPQHHPKVFQVHRLANPVSGVSGVAAGLLAKAVGWEWAFVLLALPTFVLVTGLVRLRDPKRGESINAELAAAAEEHDPISFAEARRQLFAVKTLRRLWTGAFLLGVGFVSIGQFLSLFFEDVYGYDAFGRGTIQFLRGVGVFAGLVVGARLASDATAPGSRGRLATLTGLGFAVFGGGLILMAISPWSLVSALFVVVLSAGIGLYQPPYLTLVGIVSPPRVRTQAYAWAVLFVGAGALVAIPLFGLGDSEGYRWAVAVLSGVIVAASLVGATARRFVERDAEQAEKSLSAALDLLAQFEGDGPRPLLVCRGVEVAYDQVQVLFGVDLEAHEGEIIALLGTNGAGKSTLLKAISGLVDPIGGALFFDGRDITHADAVQAARMGIVQVPGGKAVFPTLTVAEHFKAGTWMFTDEDPADVQRRIDEVLEQFPRLRERWDQMAGNMSGGEQQQLALGMAFVAKPKLLIIDELSLGLAPTVVELLLNMVRAIHAQGTTIILVEQSINVALTIATKAYFMEKGEVRFSGPTEELLERGDILRSVFLEGAGSVGDGDGDGDGAPANGEASPSGGRAPWARPADAPDPDADPEPILSVRGLTRRFGGITAVDDVTFDLMAGEILGLIGPNGAGKTTIFDLISGHLPLDAGRLVLKGHDITAMGADRRAAMGLGRSFQDARIFPSMTVGENVALGLERHIEVRDHLSSLLDLPAVQDSEQDVAWTVDDLIELMNLGAYRDKFVAELSTGTRRIVDLAMAIGHDPSVLLLDEPSSGIAQKETEALGPLLLRIQRETGCAMLVIEHDMPLIQGVSHRMMALELGAVVTIGTPQEVISNPRVVESYLGGDIDVIHRSGSSREMQRRQPVQAGAANRSGRSRRSATGGRSGRGRR